MKVAKYKSIEHEVILFELIDINNHSLIYPKTTSWSNYLLKPVINYTKKQLDDIEKEIELNPQNVLHINRQKETALHLLVAQPIPSLEIMLLLIKIFPNACKLKNIYGNLPLHLLCLRGNPCDLKILELLVDMYPESLSMQSNISSQLPIDILSIYKKVDAFDVLYRYNQNEINMKWEEQWNVLIQRNKHKINDNNTSLHIRIYENALPQEIYYMIKKYPQYLLHKNCIGRIPYDTAFNHYTQYPLRIRVELLNNIIYSMKWYRRKDMMLIAYRLFNGKYFEILKYIAIYL